MQCRKHLFVLVLVLTHCDLFRRLQVGPNRVARGGATIVPVCCVADPLFTSNINHTSKSICSLRHLNVCSELDNEGRVLVQLCGGCCVVDGRHSSFDELGRWCDAYVFSLCVAIHPSCPWSGCFEDADGGYFLRLLGQAFYPTRLWSSCFEDESGPPFPLLDQAICPARPWSSCFENVVGGLVSDARCCVLPKSSNVS